MDPQILAVFVLDAQLGAAHIAALTVEHGVPRRHTDGEIGGMHPGFQPGSGAGDIFVRKIEQLHSGGAPVAVIRLQVPHKKAQIL